MRLSLLCAWDLHSQLHKLTGHLNDSSKWHIPSVHQNYLHNGVPSHNHPSWVFATWTKRALLKEIKQSQELKSRGGISLSFGMLLVGRVALLAVFYWRVCRTSLLYFHRNSSQDHNQVANNCWLQSEIQILNADRMIKRIFWILLSPFLHRRAKLLNHLWT